MSLNDGNVNDNINPNTKKLDNLRNKLENTLKEDEKVEFLENQIEEEEEKKYMKLVWISLYVSFWSLSCVLLYTYNSKRGATIEYNRVMTQLNTNKLNEQIRKYDQKCKEYVSLAYPSKVMNEDNEIDTTGLSKIRKDMYVELIKTIEVYDKCNYIKMNTDGSPFPVSEIMISCILLILILSIIVVSNLTNNPFSKLTYDKEIREIEEMVKSKIEDGVEMDDKLKNKLNMLIRERDMNRGKIKAPGTPAKTTAPSNITAPAPANTTAPAPANTTAPAPAKTQGGATMGRKEDETKSLQETLELLQNREIEIGTRISMLKSNATFNYTSLSFCIIIFSFYISYKMLINSLRFNDNLFSGSAFMKSRCYDSNG